MKHNWFFDLDGTLADTDKDIREAWRATLDDLGIECPNFDRDFVAGPPIEVMAEILFPGLYTEELGVRLRAGYGSHYDHDGFPNTREYPGIIGKVKELKARGCKVFIATNKRWAGTKLLAAKFGWNEIFDGIYAGDMYQDDPAIGKLKKPALLAKILRERGIAAADAVLVGDTNSDFEAAKANGVESVGVTWGYGKPEELALAGSVVNSAAEIASNT